MNKYFSVFFVLMALVGCTKEGESIQMNEINNLWNKSQEQKFVLNIENIQNPKNIIFVVRNNNNYPYSNLFLITYLKNETDKNAKIDTLNYILAKPTGEWIGTGFGETKEIMFQYRNNYKFPKKGKYIIGIKQGMRTNNLVGIEDIGVKIENSKQP